MIRTVVRLEKITGVKNTDAEMRDAVLNDATKFAGADIAAIKTETESHPTLAEVEASTVLAKDADTKYLATVAMAGTELAGSISRLVYDNLNAPVGSIPTNPTLQTIWTDAKAAFLDVAISSRSSHSAANVRQSVCVTGDPANSIGKALYEIYVNRLTAARAGYLDNINQAGLLDVTAARAGYLDNINNAQLLNVPDLSTLTAARIGYLDFLNSDSKYLISTALSGTELANSIGRLIYELGVNRLTATRAGYLDEAISAAKTLTAGERTSIQSKILSDATPFAGADIAAIKTETESHPTLAEIEASTVLALKAHLVAGSGDITPPADKGIWDYLPFLTGNVALASICTEARLAELDAANLPADVDTIKTDLEREEGLRQDKTIASGKSYYIPVGEGRGYNAFTIDGTLRTDGEVLCESLNINGTLIINGKVEVN